MNRRGLLLKVSLIVGFLATPSFLVYIRFSSLPHPVVATHNQLMYWVVLRDLKEFEPEIHLALVNRFAEEANQIFEKNNASPSQLSDSQTRRLLDNIELLKKVWFEDRIATYCDINQPETCEKFMKEQVQLLEDFGNIAFKHAEILYPDRVDQNLTSISDQLFADIDRWLKETPQAKKQQTSQAVREATIFWLSTQDLAIQLMQARMELVQRIIAELKKGMDLTQMTSIVPSDRRQRLNQNSLLLMEAWIHLLANEYDRLPRDQKAEFIDDKIDSVKRWRLMEYLAEISGAITSEPIKPRVSTTPNPAKRLEQPANLFHQKLKTLNQTIRKWTEKADDDMQSKIRKVHLALQQRMFLSIINGNK